MYGSILVPVDGSKLAERALSLAMPLAEQHGARLLLLHAHEPILPLAVGGDVPLRDPAMDDKHRDDSRAYVERLAKRIAKLTSVPVEPLFRDGKVVSTICRVVEEAGVGLVVMSTHGRGGFQRFWLGSVADALVRHATVPVLLMRGARPTAKRLAGAAPFVRALVPLDGSERAERAIDTAKTLLGHGPARMTLVHVVHPMSAVVGTNLKRQPEVEVVTGYLEPLARRVATESLEVRLEVRVDANVSRVILEAVEMHDADLVVIAGQGLSGVQRFLVGSVADKLIRTATVPVLVVPTKEGGATIHA
jgi:nucleotide-binding universal stress UspA family protein